MSQSIFNFFNRLPYFAITTITKDPVLTFIQDRDLEKFKGRNIFLFDLNILQEKLAEKYPQAAQLRLVKRFPNEILILAQSRLPFAQVRIHDRIYVVDQNQVVLAKGPAEDQTLPLITGLKHFKQNVILGLPLGSAELDFALKIIESFRMQQALNSHQIVKVDVDNLSEIQLTLLNEIVVNITQERIDYKMKLLSLVLSQKDLDLEQIQYIDLRFNEPVVGKKPTKPIKSGKK